ncbi:MAG: glycosyltransferase family 4 protein [Ignavibacteria bacterium]|nr:glycosyltransferase family 4 protein [Ignavibacteria bacterium]
MHHGKGIGGAPLSLLYLIRGLDRARYQPTVLCIHESEASELFRKEGIETIVMEGVRDFSHTNVLWYPWWQLPKTLARLAHLPFAIARASAFFAQRQFDLVHLNTSTLLAFGIAAKRAGLRVVWHIREPLSRGYFGWRRSMVRRIIHRNADLVIPICNHDAQQLTPSERIHVVYNFIDFRVFDAAIDGSAVRRELGIAPEAQVVLMLGGVNRIKGTREFVGAALAVLATKQDTVFLIAGHIPGATFRNRVNGSLRYLRAVERLIPPALRESIRLIGVRSGIPELLAASTMLVFPSTVAHFARPIIEASAMGRPVIASDLGGPRELVRDGETGLLVPPCDSAALAAAMRRLLEDSAIARSSGEAGIAFAREHFDAEKNTRRIVELYEGLLAG